MTRIDFKFELPFSIVRAIDLHIPGCRPVRVGGRPFFAIRLFRHPAVLRKIRPEFEQLQRECSVQVVEMVPQLEGETEQKVEFVRVRCAQPAVVLKAGEVPVHEVNSSLVRNHVVRNRIGPAHR